MKFSATMAIQVQPLMMRCAERSPSVRSPAIQSWAATKYIYLSRGPVSA